MSSILILPEYSSKRVNVSFGGVPFDGLGEAFLEITPNGEGITEKIGADGSNAPAFDPDNSATAVLTLNRQSPVNHVLADIYDKQRRLGKLAIGDLVVDDPSGSSIYELVGSYIKQRPPQTYSKETEEQEWTFFVSDLRTVKRANGVSISVEIDAFIDNLSATLAGTLEL